MKERKLQKKECSKLGRKVISEKQLGWLLERKKKGKVLSKFLEKRLNLDQFGKEKDNFETKKMNQLINFPLAKNQKIF
jgi:hypothetical protein